MRVSSSAGFTLIEVLIALFVLSVGLLGAAAMQSHAHVAASEARQHSMARQLASSLAEAMQANRIAMSVADSANPYLNIDYDSRAGAPVPPANACFGAATCTPEELAQSDIYETTRTLHERFPHARIVVCRDASPWDASSASLVWSCDASSGAPVVIKIGWHGKDESTLITPGIALAATGGAP